MKILITTGIFPPDIGGPATQIEYLASDLAKAGLTVTVLTYGKSQKKPRPFNLVGVSKKWPSIIRQFIFGCKTFALARETDIIYTTDLYSPGFYSMLAAKFWRKKFVVRFAGDSAWETAFNLKLTQDDILTFQKKIYSSFIETRKKHRTKILKSADAVIAVSNFIKDLAIRIGVLSQKIYVVYNAVDFLPDAPKREKPSFPTLVFSGRLVPWKGVEMLVRVVSKLKERYPKISFEILGDGPELGRLKELVRGLGIGENVRFRGRVSETDSHSVFARSTVFVLNTNYEGLPHSVLNAMRVGIPVITTPVGGNPEVVQNGVNGFLAPHNDEEAWFKAIAKLLDDEDLREKFIRNGEKTLEKFKWSELLFKTIEIFKELHPEAF